MSQFTRIKVQEANFDLTEEYQRLKRNNDSDGAIVTFTGLVRDINENQAVNSLFLEHYPGMTQKSLEKIVNSARQKWQLGGISVIHRVGKLHVSEQIVFVGVTSRHRQAAFHGAEFIMDYLKTQAPFWKKEETSEGARWVDAKNSDMEKADKW